MGAWGTLLPVTWDGTQDADSQDTGRWTAANFGHMAGQLYQVEGQALQEREAVFYRYTSPA